MRHDGGYCGRGGFEGIEPTGGEGYPPEDLLRLGRGFPPSPPAGVSTPAIPISTAEKGSQVKSSQMTAH